MLGRRQFKDLAGTWFPKAVLAACLSGEMHTSNHSLALPGNGYRDGSGDEVFYDLEIDAALSCKFDSAGFFAQPRAVGQQFVDECIKTTQARLGDLLAP